MSDPFAPINASIAQTLDTLLPRQSDIAQPMVDAMRYAVLGGGKRLRPLMTCAACHAFGGDYQPALPAACGFEFIHAYSLIHDDLPAMDDDNLRHGRPTRTLPLAKPTRFWPVIACIRWHFSPWPKPPPSATPPSFDALACYQKPPAGPAWLAVNA